MITCAITISIIQEILTSNGTKASSTIKGVVEQGFPSTVIISAIGTTTSKATMATEQRAIMTILDVSAHATELNLSRALIAVVVVVVPEVVVTDTVYSGLQLKNPTNR